MIAFDQRVSHVSTVIQPVLHFSTICGKGWALRSCSVELLLALL
jgi:hypothetical protein